MVVDLEPAERLKIPILNLGHTVLADQWKKQGRAADESVRAILDDPAIAAHLAAIYAEEVLPGFALYGMGYEAERYVVTTLERFRNPFLATGSPTSLRGTPSSSRNRIAAFLDWVRPRDPGFIARA